LTKDKRPRRMILNESLTVYSTDNAVHVAVGYEATSIDPHSLEYLAHWIDDARRYFRHQAKRSERQKQRARRRKGGV
jgi:hypothetical protein